MSQSPVTILVTGAAGFLGGRVVAALLSGTSELGPVSRVIAADVTPARLDDPRADVRVGNVADHAFAESIVEPGLQVVFHLAAVLSGESESNFDLGMTVNVDATRLLLGACRHREGRQRFVFSSTIAVYGGPLPDVVPESFALRPASSYGAGKAIAELLVLEHSRRGFVEGVVCRVPTVAVRPGAPNSALSSFVSGIIREPLAGQSSNCPVPLDTRIWISSPETVVANLVHAAAVPFEALEGQAAVNFPGLSVTPREMLDSLERLAGPEVRRRVTTRPEARVSRVVCTWPGAFDATRALGLGFRADSSIDAVIREYMR